MFFSGAFKRIAFHRFYSTSNVTRVRFAPSPTGKLHLGGLRMALYNYIFAKKHNGQFILRIEDTDRNRTVPGCAEEIENLLQWAGLQPNESPMKGGSFGPYVQSKRTQLYKQKASELVDQGKAYRCFCSPIRLELLRRQQAKTRKPLGYDRSCRNLSKNEIEEKLKESKGVFAIRLALNDSANSFNDMIFGDIKESAPSTSDPIILKSDMYPTYHLANVVDDHHMQISHVLRGSEWLTSTLTHIQLYRAFGWTQPKFAHFPLINCRDGSKLSKRDNDSSVESWIDKGYEPLVLLNFLTSFGGGHPASKMDNNELWPLNQIISAFNFEKVGHHPASIDVKRLDIYSSKELNLAWKENPEIVVTRMKNLLKSKGIDCQSTDTEIKNILEPFVERINKLTDLLTFEYSFIWSPPEITWSLNIYTEEGIDVVNIVSYVIDILSNQSFKDTGDLLAKLKEDILAHNIEWPKFMRLMRKLLTNNDKGLPISELIDYLGKDKVVMYLKNSLSQIKSQTI